MESIIKYMSRNFTTILIIAVAWYTTLKINGYIFLSLEQTPIANLIFLPAAYRPAMILIYGDVGALGLILGGYLAEGCHGLDRVMQALISGGGPYLVVTAGKRFLQIPSSLAGLKPSHIIILSVSCAATNAIALNVYGWAFGYVDSSLHQLAAIFVGDVTGCAIFLFALSTALSFVMPRPQADR